MRRRPRRDSHLVGTDLDDRARGLLQVERPIGRTIRTSIRCNQCICLRGEPAGAVITLLFRAGGWRGRAERQDKRGTRPTPHRRRRLPSARERRHAPRVAGSRPLRAARRSPRRDHRPRSPSAREAEACPPRQRGSGSQTTGQYGCRARHPHRVTHCGVGTVRDRARFGSTARDQSPVRLRLDESAATDSAGQSRASRPRQGMKRLRLRRQPGASPRPAPATCAGSRVAPSVAL